MLNRCHFQYKPEYSTYIFFVAYRTLVHNFFRKLIQRGMLISRLNNFMLHIVDLNWM